MSGFFNVSAFYNDLQNQQLQATAIGKPGSGLPGARLIVNAGESSIHGVEVESSLLPFDGFRLDAGYAYLDTELKEFTAPTLAADSPFQNIVPAVVGGDLPLSPEHRFTTSATYTLPVGESIGKISLGATYVYTSRQVANDTSPFGRMPSSELVNLNFDWKSIAGSQLDLAAFVTNLTEEEFPVNVAGNFESNGYESVVTNVPRMYGVRLKYSFGN